MNSRLRELHRTLAGLQFRRDGSAIDQIRYTGVINASGRKVHSAIILEDLELTRLPRLHLLTPSEDVPELLAHIQDDGDYCYARRDSIVLDRFNIARSIANSVQLMRASLERSLTVHATAEIAVEFPQHWFGSTVYVDIKNVNARRAGLFLLSREDGTALNILSDSDRMVRMLGINDKKMQQAAELVRTSNNLTFQRGATRPETFGAFLDWLSTVDTDASGRALAAAGRSRDQLPHIFILAPNGAAGIRLDVAPALLRALRRPTALGRYIDRNRYAIKLTRVTGEPIDPNFIYTRNMSEQPNLSGKTIVLVGCGTIGSHLAKMLAQSGAGYGTDGHLCLIDQQELGAGNIGRHLLGAPDIGRKKSVAVRDFLKRLYPDLNISAKNADVVKQMDSLYRSELVIDATGDEGVANAINAHLVRRRQNGESAPASIFVWLFGNGAAAQALSVTSLNDACYRCLRPEHGKPWRFNPLKSDYVAREVPANCGEGPYFPYGVAAPVTAAALALQMALDWTKGEPSPLLRTQRFSYDDTQQVKDQDPSRSTHCPACGTEHKA